VLACALSIGGFGGLKLKRHKSRQGRKARLALLARQMLLAEGYAQAMASPERQRRQARGDPGAARCQGPKL
jgi:hypothetical protein